MQFLSYCPSYVTPESLWPRKLDTASHMYVDRFGLLGGKRVSLWNNTNAIISDHQSIIISRHGYARPISVSLRAGSMNFSPTVSGVHDIGCRLKYNKTTRKIYLYHSETLIFSVNSTIVSRPSISRDCRYRNAKSTEYFFREILQYCLGTIYIGRRIKYT